MVKLVTLEGDRIVNAYRVSSIHTSVHYPFEDARQIKNGGAHVYFGEHAILVSSGDKEKIIAAMKRMEAEREERTELLRDLLAQTVLELPSTVSSAISGGGVVESKSSRGEQA